MATAPPLRIAQVAPLFESVPPRAYGGTERVVHHLTEALVEQGHEVTLFASGDSRTSARLVPCSERSLRRDFSYERAALYHAYQLEQLLQRADELDVVHFHVDCVHFPVSARMPIPSLTTLHGRLDRPELPLLFGEFPDTGVVSISDDQRRPLPWAKWLGTVHHGLPPGLYRPVPRAPGKDGYLAFLGRMSPEKRPDRAIEVAVRAGVKLRMAAKVDPSERGYFENHIRPLLAHPLVEFVGELDEDRKNDFLGRASALLFPIDWPEPFGLVMIESMACGTPVIAFRNGSVPEIVEPGTSGFVVSSVDEAVAAVRRIGEIDRNGCRAAFERRFTQDRMASRYADIYRRLLPEARAPGHRFHSRPIPKPWKNSSKSTTSSTY